MQRARDWIVDSETVKAFCKSFAFFLSILLTQVGLDSNLSVPASAYPNRARKAVSHFA